MMALGSNNFPELPALAGPSFFFLATLGAGAKTNNEIYLL